MNDERTTQIATTPIVLKIKTYDDVSLPHTSRLSIDTLNECAQSSSIPTNDACSVAVVSPSICRVKLKKPLTDNNDEDDEYAISNTSDIRSCTITRSKTSVKNHSLLSNASDCISDRQSSQQDMHETMQSHCVVTEPPSNSSLILKIRRDSLSSTTGNRNTMETETSQPLLVKFKQNEYGELTATTNSNAINHNNEYVNGCNGSLHEPLNPSMRHENQSPMQPHITNMLSSLNDDKQWSNHQNHLAPRPTTPSHVSIDVDPTSPMISSTTTAPAGNSHTEELLDEALDSVKSVLMQTFKKNLESGGDLNALKSTLSSDEVAEVFLSKLRESLKRETTSTVDNEHKLNDHQSMISEVRSCSTPTVSTPLNTIISPIMNVVSPSPSSASSPLPSISTIIARTTPPSTPLSSSPQPPTMTNNKRKSSNPSTNPNRFDGATEEELSKRLLSDILQPNLDIVFVGINPSLYAVHKGHHYGGPGNHFWKLLHMSDLIPNAFTPENDYRMPQYGIGFTNIVQRPSKAGSDITKDEITAGAEILMQKIKMYKPKIVAFNGRGIYEVYAGNKHFHYGKQPDLFPGTDTHVFVMPSSSARCSQLPRAEDKLPFYIGLRKLRDFLNGKLYTLNEAEITFPDIKIKDTDDVLQKTIIRISNKPFSELSPETLKTFGDKFPSGQMTSKHNSDTETTQTMSILNNQTNGNLLNYDQQTSITTTTITNGIISSKNSLLDNMVSNTAMMNDTDQAVLAALANGTFNSSSQSRQGQTVYVGRQPQPQQPSLSYLVSSIKSTSTNISSRASTPPSNSHTIHHLPQLSSHDYQISSSPSSSSSSSVPLLPAHSQTVSHQIVVINPKERSLPTTPILTSSSLKELLSSQTTVPKQTFLVPTNPPIVQNSSVITDTNTMDENNHRYHPYYRTNSIGKRYDHVDERQYQKNNKYRHHQYSALRCDNKNYKEFSDRRSHRNDYHYQNQQAKSRIHTSFSPPPLSLSSPVPLMTVVPHKRESWIRSVKKTKDNESVEQKTQYLETMLRMPQQQKLSLNSSRFDRIRFTDQQLHRTTSTTDNDKLDNSSFHLVDHMNKNDEIYTLERILFDKQITQEIHIDNAKSNHVSLSTPPRSIPQPESGLCPAQQTTTSVPNSGFLIENCDDEEPPPISSPPRPDLPPLSTDELTLVDDKDTNERRTMLLNELDVADAERKQELKRHKQLSKTLKKKHKVSLEKAETGNDKHECASDWIIEHDNDINSLVSKLAEEIHQTSITISHEDKISRINMILTRIQRQQEHLRKVQKYLTSILGEQGSLLTTTAQRQNSFTDHDLLLSFANRSTNSDCWLCSGKLYTEVAIQCDRINEQ